MIPATIGDLSQSFVQRRASTRLSMEMSRLGQELTSGVKSDLGAAMSGDTRPLAGLERSLTGLDAYRTATAEAKIFADTTQATLGRISGALRALQPSLLAIQTGGDSQVLDVAIDAARDSFESIISALNTQVSGRSLFAGTATEEPALRSGSDILADLAVLVTGAANATDVETAIDGYFASGGTFQTGDYLGSGRSRAALKVSSDDEVSLTLRADDAVLRETLATLAKSAVLARGVLADSPNVRAELARGSGMALLDAERRVIGLQGAVGTTQARIEEIETRNQTERATLEMARNDMIAADPYETASRIEQVEAQLQSLYTITARMARLNLTNYL